MKHLLFILCPIMFSFSSLQAMNDISENQAIEQYSLSKSHISFVNFRPYARDMLCYSAKKKFIRLGKLILDQLKEYYKATQYKESDGLQKDAKIAVLVAAAHAHLNFLQLFDEVGVNIIDVEDHTQNEYHNVLTIAALHGYENIIDFLLQLSKRKNKPCKLVTQALSNSIFKNHLSCTIKIVQNFNCNALNGPHGTLKYLNFISWIIDCYPNRIAHARELLKAGYNPDRKNLEGKVALHFAAEKNDLDYIALLLEYGCDPNIKEPKKGFTALMFAIENGSLPAVDLLKQGTINPELMKNKKSLREKTYLEILPHEIFNEICRYKLRSAQTNYDTLLLALNKKKSAHDSKKKDFDMIIKLL